MTPAKLWSRQFTVAVVVNMLMSMVFYLLLTSMAGYAVQRFSASDSVAGLASSSFIVGAVFGRLISGKFLDFVGRRRMLMAAMALLAVAGLAYIPVTDLTLLISLRIVHGVAFGVGNTALVASVQSVIPPTRRGEGNGFFSVATTVSTALGPFLALWLSRGAGFTMVFLLAGLSGAAALVAAIFYTVPNRVPTDAERAAKWSLKAHALVDVDGLKIGSVMLIAGVAYVPLLSFLALYTQKLGIDDASGTFFVMFALAALVSRPLAGRIQDRYGDNIVAIPAFASFTAGMTLIALAGSTTPIVIAGLLIGAGFASLMSIMLSILINRVPVDRVGVATSTFYLLLDGGSGLGPLLLGLAIVPIGFRGMFWIATGLSICAMACYLVVHGRDGRRPGPLRHGTD